ncbi:MAG: T9SS type A sorting domain-containing protein [Bacteroidetes bacterium]|nr:T9SS type A sorting domain-containing protein [Bacteroidota bacterium]
MKFKLLFGFYLSLLSLGLKAQSSACLASDTLKIVVIGSSTAAGSGASPSDSAWVNRYRHYLQSINPNNEVVNLARGGYNTWRLMHDSFSPPSNRPQPDTLRNISHALRQNPDAIIINLPSNDAAIGTGINQQMSNFIAMDSLANLQGVPVWVCTTQPRNFGSSSIQIQLGVRDSISAYFGSKALDFWTGLANSQNTIDSTYDSGDGVHVNNAGHKLLSQIAIQAALPDSLVQGLAGIDLSLSRPLWLNPSSCGQSNSIFSIELANHRFDSLQGQAQILLIRENQLTGSIDTFSQNISALAGCAYQSLNFSLNNSSGGDLMLHAELIYPNDANSNNNRSASLKISLAPEVVLSTADTVSCASDSLNLSASSLDDIRWFSDPLLQQEISRGANLAWPGNQSDTLYLQAYRGPYHYIDQLSASPTSNIFWNGCMFNLIAKADTVYIDSLLFYSGSSGDLQVNLRSYLGSYLGNEGNPALWSAVQSDSVYGAAVDSVYILSYPGLKINPYDTLACYLYLENSSQRLAYQSASNLYRYPSTGLDIEAGSGVSHTFGSTYFPRHFRGQFYYHYGYNDVGQCQSKLDTIIIRKSTAELDLGQDTIILTYVGDFSVLNLPTGFSNPLWSDSTSANSMTVNHPASPITINAWHWLEAQDSLGCLHRDSVYFEFLHYSDLDENESKKYQIYPNPSSQGFTVESSNADQIYLRLFSLDGALLRQTQFKGQQYYWDPKLQAGVYILQISDSEGMENLKIQIQ